MTRAAIKVVTIAAMATPTQETGVQWVFRTRCLCGSGREKWTVALNIPHRTAGGEIALIHCSHCGLVFSDPYPSEETVWLLYADKHSANDTNFEAIGDTVIDRLKDAAGRRQLRAILPAAARAAVLDFGTGNGRFALICSELMCLGAKVDAVDYQADPPAALHGLYSVRYLNVRTWAREEQLYDLILLRHVLEHNHHPDALLRSLAARLSPTGRLYIEVPNFHSWFVGKLGKYVNTPQVPWHLWHFTAQSLRDLVESCGLECSIGYSEMPLMGTSLAMLLGRDKTLVFQLAGIVLHPVQMLASALFGKPCVTAVCRIRLH